MPSDFTVVEAKAYHCGQIIRILRREHQKVVALTGVNGHRELRALFDMSSLRRAWLIDGKLAALGGVTGTSASPFGFLWFTMSEAATRYPIAVVKMARQQLDEAMVVRRELATTILVGDEAAKRLAIFLGFHTEDFGEGSPAETREGRRRLSRYLNTEQDLQIKAGDGHAIVLGYHHGDE